MNVQIETLRKVFISALGMNIASLLMGIIYFIIGPEMIFGTLFTIILIISWFLDIGLIFLDDLFIMKEHPNGKQINRIGYGFLMVQILATFFFVGGNFLMNAQWASAPT